MEHMALQVYQIKLESAIEEWIAQKKIRTGSEKTVTAYRDTMLHFRAFLAQGNLDLLDNPIDVARVATLWASLRNDEGKKRHPDKEVSPSTYNQRLAILSSFYTFLQEVYHLDVPNPIESVKKRPVQAYAAASNLKPSSRALRTSIEPPCGGYVIMRSWLSLLPLVAGPMSLSLYDLSI